MNYLMIEAYYLDDLHYDQTSAVFLDFIALKSFFVLLQRTSLLKFELFIKVLPIFLLPYIKLHPDNQNLICMCCAL